MRTTKTRVRNFADVSLPAELAAMNSGKPRQDQPVKTHAASGYTWTHDDDAPGHAWLSKKAVDDVKFAGDAIVHAQYAVNGECLRAVEECEAGGVCELTERRRSIRRSV